MGCASEPGGADLQGAQANDQGKLEHWTRASDAHMRARFYTSSLLGAGGGLVVRGTREGGSC